MMAPALPAAIPLNQEGEKPTEQALARLWQNASSLSQGLVTEEGQQLRVIYPGRANPRAGPDFCDAVVSNEQGQLLTGDVELHLRAPDWYSHRHHVDPNYNGVILHVVLWPKGSAASLLQSGLSSPVASLDAAWAGVDGAESPVPDLFDQLRSLDDDGLYTALCRAGDQRFLYRSRGFTLELGQEDPDRVLYGTLMEGLGYASNRRPFRELSRNVPYGLLQQLIQEPPATRLLALEALLIGAAGLLPHVTPQDKAKEVRRLLKYLPRAPAISEDKWQLFRVRPANHPLWRIAGAAALVDRYMNGGLTYSLADLVLKGNGRTLLEALTARPYIGEGRAGDLAVNAVLPFVHAYARLRRSFALQKKCVDLFQAFPTLEDNELTREMGRLLGLRSRGLLVSGARMQQGLVQLYKDGVRGTSRSSTSPRP